MQTAEISKPIATLLASLCLLTLVAAEPTPPTTFLGSKPGAQTNILNIPFCLCPPGTFTMGSPPTESERRYDHIGFRVVAVKI